MCVCVPILILCLLVNTILISLLIIPFHTYRPIPPVSEMKKKHESSPVVFHNDVIG